MVQRAARENREAHGWFAGRAGETRLGVCALGLALLGGVLALAPGLPFDARWGAVLASASLDVLIAVAGTRLYVERITVAAAERVPLWKTLSGLARLALRHDTGKRKNDKGKSRDAKPEAAPSQADAPDASDMHALLRSLPWRPVVAPLLALVSLALAMLAWQRPAFQADAANPQAPLLVALACAFALAFGVLLVERMLAHYGERAAMSNTRDASNALAALLRVLLVAALGAAASLALSAFAGVSPTWLVRIAAVLSAAVAVELAVRAAWAWFSAPMPQAGQSWVLSSSIAQTLRPHARPLAALDAQLRARYGIDLRQNWALQSFVRLLPATLALMLLTGWLLGGVTVLGPDQRAVYERFGAPVAVWQPGLHVGLPWPFGRARVIDNGAIHQLIVSGSAGDDAGAGQRSVPASASLSADGRTPPQLDRLWDVAHPWETTQVIAGTSSDQQAFQIVSADVRLDYRIGLSDAAARAALYRAVDLDQTVRSIANREVVRYLASRTLPALLDTPQTAMAATLRGVVQHELDRAIGGIEVVAVVIESVHPPAGAAAAYHGVQAAQIRAEASVAEARGFAAATVGGAQRQAIETIAQGSANGADALAAARVQQAGFDADVIAQGLGGPAFAFEYYLHALQKGLQNANLTIIDDRLASGARATFDLRPLQPGMTSAKGVRPAW